MDVQLRSQTKIETPERPKELYCIQHEAMVRVEYGTECGMGHVITASGEVDYCCFEGGYAFVSPPAELADLPEGWELQPGIISDDERAAAEVEEMGIWGTLE